LRGAAFGVPSPEERSRIYARIPERVDILITHSPPYGILDTSDRGRLHGGCQELRKAVERAKPKVHIFGHVHGCRGIVEAGSTTYINATVLDETGGILQPVVFRLKHAKGISK
jgi:Icc-related predicted phosphoesterase